MIERTVDRNSAEHAEKIMSALCSSMHEQQVILRQLRSSISIADQHAPKSWAVTLFSYGFRLNVGPVEVYTFFDGEVRLFMLGFVPDMAQQHGKVVPTDFHSMPQHQSCFICSGSHFKSVATVLQPVHREFVQTAAVTSRGIPRKGSSYIRSHSPGLLDYAKRIVTENLSMPPEKNPSDSFVEGAIRRVSSNVYERNSAARDRCIEVHGRTCVVCGFDFQKVYGAAAVGFIHVHHVTSLSAIGQSYDVNPITDLVPLCPNCHSVVHLTDPPFTIEQVKTMLVDNQTRQD